MNLTIVVSIMWLSCAAAASFGAYETHSSLCMLAMVVPLFFTATVRPTNAGSDEQ